MATYTNATARIEAKSESNRAYMDQRCIFEVRRRIAKEVRYLHGLNRLFLGERYREQAKMLIAFGQDNFPHRY